MARKGIKIRNSTRLEATGLRAMLYAALDRREFEGKLRVEFQTYSRGRTRLRVAWGPGWFRVKIPNAMQRPDRLRELRRALGAYLLWSLGEMKGVKHKTDWGWGEQFELSLQPEPPKRTMADLVNERERKARALLARLEAELESLDAKRRSIKARIYGAREKVKYYERRGSKAAKEADFLERVKDKVRALEDGPEAPAN